MGVQPIAIPASLAYVLNSAGDKSGVDFNYLLQTAQRESALNPNAKAPSSSAVGLFQFLDSTWLQVMKEEGPRLGYQKYADAISVDRDGDYTIKDKALRAEVLKLREDPQVAADMAAAFTRSNGAYLEAKFGRMPSPGELYIAHFLGPQGAEKLFRAGLDNPDQVAAKLFPKQAKANPQIFYADGQARSIREVYKALVAKHDGIVAAPLPADPDPKFVAQQMAGDADAKWPADAVPSRFSKADMSFTALFATDKSTGLAQPLVGVAAARPLVDALGGAPLVDGAGAQQQLLEAMGTQPLLAIDAVAPTAATDDDSALGYSATPTVNPSPLDFVPLPAPTPLLAVPPVATVAPAVPTDLVGDGPAPVPETAAPPAAPVDPGMPRPRLLMTNPSAEVTTAYAARLYAGSRS